MPSSRSKFVISKSKSGKYRWKLVVRGTPVAVSKEYPNASQAKRAVASLANHVQAPVVDE